MAKQRSQPWTTAARKKHHKQGDLSDGSHAANADREMTGKDGKDVGRSAGIYVCYCYPPGDGYISHQTGKGKSSTQICHFWGDMLVPWRVLLNRNKKKWQSHFQPLPQKILPSAPLEVLVVQRDILCLCIGYHVVTS